MSKGKILFIDDDNFLRKVYQAELKDKGFDVFLAVDGEDGLQKVSELQPDIVILDLIMPKKSGFEVLADLQQSDETRNIPVVVLSNLAQSDDQKRALDLGAVDYLIKDNTTLDIIAEKIEYHLHAPRPVRPAVAKKEVQPQARPSASAQKEKTAATPAPVPAQNQQPANRGRNFCPNCGFHLNKSDKFCPDCGTVL